MSNSQLHTRISSLFRPLTSSLALPRSCPICEFETLPRSLTHRNSQSVEFTINEVACRRCQSILPWNDQACIQCAQAKTTSSSSQLCGDCAKSKRAYHFNFATTAFRYEPPISSLIQAYKFNHDFRLLPLFAASLADTIQRSTQQSLTPDCLIPIPLHPSKQRARGFNQSEWLAKTISARLNIPCHAELLIKTRQTKAQSSLNTKAERQKNIKNSFDYTELDDATKLQIASYKHLAVIDDVITTTATANEAAKMLKRLLKSIQPTARDGKKNDVATISLYAIVRA